MTIPDYQTLMAPVLRVVGKASGPIRLRDLTEPLGEELGLATNELQELLPSGQGFLFHSRIGWAVTYLVQAGLLSRPSRGFVEITSEGTAAAAAAANLGRIDNQFLERYPSFRDFRHRGRQGRSIRDIDDVVEGRPLEPEASPEELLESTWQEIRAQVAHELLDRIKGSSPLFFEQLVIDVLVSLGYGGNSADAARAIGRTGDGGIDGIIKEDVLGLDAIYVQAKRWDDTIGRPEIQKFAGSLDGERARKGVFITTSGFTGEARKYVSQIEKKIVLIDGAQLVELMLEHGVGVQVERTYPIHRLDNDYFDT